ncbi:DUF443 family protein [Staphylococcus epidermidis]|uniref:DUF443 family protein n=3 Tax=Staphylococcus epidermidis TaxID=1282 RepID=UPI0015FA1617|nr:DUF443 family protein [Staphylococcus epidermidis]MBB1176624.1 DUF443 family protein [Staphylococcus epidermidis]MCG1234772.1 DUF443 family protein [Staphylococcus epidermidis]MCG1250853.1 DUF443 family protein [Staphylococcus epidermidis]MCG1254220.1 DUF443 family protein [Staphylococcus epidermidis]MCG1406819.1 DUF443 family protein [Staphylococcus epidermidis]
MGINDLNDNQKFRTKMYRIHKNPRYKLIELDQKKYLIDLESNYFTYLFPPLNWILKKELIEVSNDKLNEIEYDDNNNKEQAKNIGCVSGGGVLIATLMRPFMDLMDVPSNQFINSLIVIVTVLVIVFIRGSLRKKWDLKIKSNKIHIIKCIVRSKLKHMFFVIESYLMFLLLSLLIIGLIFGVENNLMIYIGSPLIFFMFSLINLITYDNEEVIISKLSQSE